MVLKRKHRFTQSYFDFCAERVLSGWFLRFCPLNAPYNVALCWFPTGELAGAPGIAARDPGPTSHCKDDDTPALGYVTMKILTVKCCFSKCEKPFMSAVFSYSVSRLFFTLFDCLLCWCPNHTLNLTILKNGGARLGGTLYWKKGYPGLLPNFPGLSKKSRSGGRGDWEGGCRANAQGRGQGQKQGVLPPGAFSGYVRLYFIPFKSQLNISLWRKWLITTFKCIGILSFLYKTNHVCLGKEERKSTCDSFLSREKPLLTFWCILF